MADDQIEPAKSGRSRCRGCREKIEKGELRFGEAVPNPYDDDEDATTLHWFHLMCGADRRSDKVAEALASFDGDVPDRPALEAAIELGVKNPGLCRVQRAERAPSGRARCRECRELIEKDALRVVVDMEEEVASPMPSSYYVHAGCAAKHVGGDGLLAKLRRVSADLGEDDVEELAGLL